MKISGAEALMRSLIAQNVDIIFGYPGGAIMPAYDALFDHTDKIQHVLVRHEQGAAHAAEGYARMSGKVGVCMATSGPGATNLVTGIADAMMDSVPIVCITGQVASHFVGTDAFQEADIVGITTPITKWNCQVTKADEIAYVIAKAFYIASSGRPGPVLIDITKNAQIELCDYKPFKKITLDSYKPKKEIHSSQLKKAAELINSAKQPLMLVGHGVHIASAYKEVLAFVNKTGIPAATTLHGLSAIPVNNKLYVGLLGMHGRYGANILTNQADLIIAVGMRFDDRVTGRASDYAKKAKVIHIDIDEAEINKIIPTTVAIVADAKDALAKLIPMVKKNSFNQWLSQFRHFDEIEYEKVTRIELAPSNGHIRMTQVIDKLSSLTRGKAVIVADVGQHQMIAARYYNFAKENSFITSGGLGTMGFALPASIGAKFALPKREVIAIIGDGGFQMTIQELATIAQEKLKVKIIILNNNYLGMVRQWQELFFAKRYSFVDLKNPDFVAVTKGFNINAEKIDHKDKLEAGLKRMLSSKEPYLLEVVCQKEENVFPMVPSGASCDEVVLE